MNKQDIIRLSKNDITIFQEQAIRFSSSQKTKNKVSQKEQQIAVDELNHLIPYESFYFIVDALKYEVQNVNGVEKWLGYPDHQFTMHKYFRIMESKNSLSRNLYKYHFNESLLSGERTLSFKNKRLITFCTLKKQDGLFINVKRSTYVFQLDQENRVKEYLDLFVVISETNNSNYFEYLNFKKVNQHLDWQSDLQKKVIHSIQQARIFSHKQFQILKYFAENKDDNLNLRIISDELCLNIENLKTQVSRVRDKINFYCGTQFQESLFAMNYFIDQGLMC